MNIIYKTIFLLIAVFLPIFCFSQDPPPPPVPPDPSIIPLDANLALLVVFAVVYGYKNIKYTSNHI